MCIWTLAGTVRRCWSAQKPIKSQNIGTSICKKIINYGATKRVGIFVYVNQRALYGNLDELFSLYQKWGLKGVKFGFVQIGSNRWSTWLHDAVKKAAEYQLLVDIHDEYRPTGF